MKRTLLIVLVSTFTGVFNGLIAQGLQAGIKGSLNSTWLLNKNISDAPTIEQDYVPSFGDSYGLSGAIYFTKKLGIEVNFLMANHTQKYADDQESYESETQLRKLDIPVLLKFKSLAGAYLEMGLQYSSFTSAEYKIAFDSLQIGPIDVRDKTSKSSVDAMLGIGIDLPIAAGFTLTAALRFTRSLTDVKGVDAFGNDLSDETVLSNQLLGYEGEYEGTHSMAAGFLVGLTYSIGRISGG